MKLEQNKHSEWEVHNIKWVTFETWVIFFLADIYASECLYIPRFQFLCKSVFFTYVSGVTVGWSTFFLLVTGTCRSWCWDDWRHVCHSLWENKSPSPSHEEQNVRGILSLIRNVGLHRCMYSQCTQVLNLQIQGQGFWQVWQSRALGRSLWLSWAFGKFKVRSNH